MQFLGVRKFWTVEHFILLFFLCQVSNSTPDESAVRSAIGWSDHPSDLPVQIDYAKLLEAKSQTLSDEKETNLNARGIFSRFGGSIPKSETEEPVKEQDVDSGNYEDDYDPAEAAQPEPETKQPSGPGWWSNWGSPTPKPTPITPEPKSVAQTENKSPSGGWFSGWFPSATKAPEEPKVARRDPSGGWLGGLWGSSSPKDASSEDTPAQKLVPKAGGLLGGWFSGSPAQEAQTESKKSKQHGPLRQLVKSVEHTIYPKSLRLAVKSIPGVHSTRRALKSTLDTIDSIGDTEYVTNIRNAAVGSSERVGTKAVNLADSVWELGTGTSEVTLNMVDTLQKEGARAMDTVSVACPPAKPAVDFVNTKVGDGVVYLQNGNDQIRKGGKAVLSKIASFAKRLKPDAEKEAEKPPASNSWW